MTQINRIFKLTNCLCLWCIVVTSFNTRKHPEEKETVLSHMSMRSMRQAGITAVFTGQTINVCASFNIEKVIMQIAIDPNYLSSLIVLISSVYIIPKKTSFFIIYHHIDLICQKPISTRIPRKKSESREVNSKITKKKDK